MYKRIILKLSGEALAGDKEGVMYDNDTIFAVVEQIKSILDMGTQVALVIGGGNIWRGRSSNAEMDRTKADQIGMLATVMNAVYVADAFRQKGVKATVQTPIIIGTVTEQFSKEKAASRLEAGEVVIFAAGIGHPYFSTDTVTALRGAELEADILLQQGRRQQWQSLGDEAIHPLSGVIFPDGQLPHGVFPPLMDAV